MYIKCLARYIYLTMSMQFTVKVASTENNKFCVVSKIEIMCTFLTGNKWRTHRKMIAPTFHINILKSFISVFNQNSKKVVEKLRSEVGKTFDVHDYMSTATVDILLGIHFYSIANNHISFVYNYSLLNLDRFLERMF